MEPCQRVTVRGVAERTQSPHTHLGGHDRMTAPLRRDKDKSSQSFALGALENKEMGHWDVSLFIDRTEQLFSLLALPSCHPPVALTGTHSEMFSF